MIKLQVWKDISLIFIFHQLPTIYICNKMTQWRRNQNTQQQQKKNKVRLHHLTRKLFTKEIYKLKKNTWVSRPKTWVSWPKYLGELTKALGWVGHNLGELVTIWVSWSRFGWVGFWVSCPTSGFEHDKYARYILFIYLTVSLKFRIPI